jgi:60S ribosome biogenesis protein Rrp14
MGKGQKRTRDSDAAAAPTAPAANPVPSKRQPPVIPEGFPGPRSGFLLQHSRSASSGGGDKTAVTANADAVSADSSYISAMISLIPPEYYVPKSEEEKEATWTKYSKVCGVVNRLSHHFPTFTCCSHVIVDTTEQKGYYA